MITLNAIAKRLEEFGTNHFFIKSYSFGSPDDVDLDKFQDFPLMHVVYTGSDYEERTKTFSFEVYVFDRPNREEQMTVNQREVVSDAQQCLEDVIADIANGGNIFLFDEDYEVTTAGITPLIDERSNLLTGALLDLTIQVPYQRDACNLPLDGVQPEGGEFTYARRGLLRMLTLNGETDVLSVNTIRVPNGTLTDNGNGDVTLSISGAGGGVSSVNEVEPDVNGNIALDTDDIPEGDSNLYYTDARADARIAAASVTDLSDVTSAGSGAIITASERTQIGTNTSAIAANAGAISTLDGEAIKSVNSLLPTAGAITLDTDDIGEGGTNIYYTDARVDARVAALDLATESYVDTQVGSEESARISADSVLQGQINTLAGSVSTNATDISNLENGVGNVTSLNSLTGAVTLSAGSNVTLTQVGNDIEISSSGGGGGGGSDSFSTIAVPGQSSIVADHGNDTLNINAGTGVALTTNAGTDTLTIGTTISVNGEPADASGDIAVDTGLIPEGTNLYYTEARVSANVNVAANTAKLAGIEAGAEVNVNADWNATSGDAEILNKPTIPDEIAQLSGNTDDLAEGQTNKYFTDARADARISAASILDLNDTPSTYGTNGQVLTTNGAGGTTWATPTGGDTFPKNHALWQGFVSGVTSWPAAPGFAAWSAIAQHLEVEWDSASATNAAKEYVVPATGLYECNGFFTIVGQGSNTVKIILPVFVNGVRTLDMSRTTKSVFFNEYDGVGGTGVLPLSAGDVVTFNLYLLAISGAMPKLATDRLALHFAMRMIDA